MAASAHALARNARRSSASARHASVESTVQMAGVHALASSNNSLEDFRALLYGAAQHSGRTSCDGQLQVAGEGGLTPGGAAGGLLSWSAFVRRMLHFPGAQAGVEEESDEARPSVGNTRMPGATEAGTSAHGGRRDALEQGGDAGGLEAWQYCGEMVLKGRVATLETYALQAV